VPFFRDHPAGEARRGRVLHHHPIGGDDQARLAKQLGNGKIIQQAQNGVELEAQRRNLPAQVAPVVLVDFRDAFSQAGAKGKKISL